MTSVECDPRRPLYELLSLHGTEPGMQHMRRVASASVGGFDAQGVTVLQRKVSEWATADLAKELESAFTVEPVTLMAQAWSRLRAVRKAADASRGPPPSLEPVALLEHELEASVDPRLVLNVNGLDWCELKLSLSLKLSFESVVLELFDGALVGLRLGHPGGTVSLQCQGQDLGEFKRELKLPGTLRIDPPLALGFAAGPASAVSAASPASAGAPAVQPLEDAR